MIRIKASLLIALCAAALCQAQVAPSIDSEIARLRKELAQTQLDCQRTSQEITKDAKDFAAYREKSALRLQQARVQIDTLNTEIGTQSRLNDSLGAVIAGLQAQGRQIDLGQEEFRQRLIQLCQTCQPALRRLPPLALNAASASLGLLINDLTTKSTDVTDGCGRLITLLGRLEESCTGIQIAQESSPAAEITGTVYRLRVGTFFEGIVDGKGEKCAIFTGYTAQGAPRWQLGSSANASALLTAVNIREGKALPAFAQLPIPADDSTASPRGVK